MWIHDSVGKGELKWEELELDSSEIRLPLICSGNAGSLLYIVFRRKIYICTLEKGLFTVNSQKGVI